MSGVIEDYHQALMTERDKVRRLENQVAWHVGALAEAVRERDKVRAERDALARYIEALTQPPQGETK